MYFNIDTIGGEETMPIDYVILPDWVFRIVGWMWEGKIDTQTYTNAMDWLIDNGVLILQ